MQVKEFATMLQKELSDQGEKMQVNRRVEYRVIRKNNGVEHHGMLIHLEKEVVAPCIYLEVYKQEYEDGRPLTSIAQEIEELWVKQLEQIKGRTIDISFESVKERIVFRLVHYGKNKKELDHMPYLPVLNLALTFHVAMMNEEDELGMFQITNTHLKHWKVSKEEIIGLALENTPRLFPPTCRTMEEVLKISLSDVPMYVISNSIEVNGASAILYPKVLTGLAEQLESDFYLLPSSIHEFILIPYQESYDVDVLKETVREINRYGVPDEDILSDEVYFFDRKRKVIRTL